MAVENWKTPLQEIADPLCMQKWAKQASDAEIPLSLVAVASAESFDAAYLNLLDALARTSKFASANAARSLFERGDSAVLDCQANKDVLAAAVAFCKTRNNKSGLPSAKKEAWGKCQRHIAGWLNAFSSDAERLQTAIALDRNLHDVVGELSVSDALVHFQFDSFGELPPDVEDIVRWYVVDVRAKYRKDITLKLEQVACPVCGGMHDEGTECPHCKRAAEEAERKRKEEERERERQRKKAEAEERKRKEEERRKAEAEEKRRAAEERRRKEEERRKAEQERKRQEEAERQRLIEEERRRKAEEAERKRKEELEALRKKVVLPGNALSCVGEGQVGKWAQVRLKWIVPADLFSAGQMVRLVLSRADGVLGEVDVLNAAGVYEDNAVEVGKSYEYVIREFFEGQPNGESRASVSVGEMLPPTPVKNLCASRMSKGKWRVEWNWPEGVDGALVVRSCGEEAGRIDPARAVNSTSSHMVVRGGDLRVMSEMLIPPDTTHLVVFAMKYLPSGGHIFSGAVSVPVLARQFDIHYEIVGRAKGFSRISDGMLRMLRGRSMAETDLVVRTDARSLPGLVVVDGGRKRPLRASDGVPILHIPACPMPREGVARFDLGVCGNPECIRLFLANPTADSSGYRIALRKQPS